MKNPFQLTGVIFFRGKVFSFPIHFLDINLDHLLSEIQRSNYESYKASEKKSQNT